MHLFRQLRVARLSTAALSPTASAKQGKAYVGGLWVHGAAKKSVAVLNPATFAPLAEVPDMDVGDVNTAISAASDAFPAWKGKLAKERSAILRKWFDLIVANGEELAQLMTAECGKPITESRGEVAYGASFVEWYAEEAKRTYGEVIPQTIGGRRLLVIKQPVGVCALITPWNFPLAMITRKAAPALAAGCTVVIKPAIETPLSALALCDLALKAGVPAGVINVVTCSASNVTAVGDLLCTSPSVKKLSFTGSTKVGAMLASSCALSMKRVSMELGGNAPFIVFEDADIDAAVTGALASKFRNSGQTCVCANRMFVHASVYDAFVAKFSARVAALKLGDGSVAGVELGPLINAAGLAKTQRLLADAVAKGASVITGGSRPSTPLAGNFFSATVLTGITQDMDISREEVFGPIAPIAKFTSDDEVIKLANSVNVGLAAYFYARDIGRVWRVAEALEVGMVSVNEGILSSEVVPFGGVKMSGIGREGGRVGIDEYLEPKYINMGGLGV